jgi:hypothetical protein
MLEIPLRDLLNPDIPDALLLRNQSLPAVEAMLRASSFVILEE